MPRALFRFLATALLALMIPIQGMASVAAGQCMALGHPQDGGSQDHDHGQAHDDGAQGHGHASHSHAEDTAAHDDEGGTNSHCGPCTACCGSASISAPVAVALPGETSDSPYVSSQSVPPSVQLDELDRPPLAL